MTTPALPWFPRPTSVEDILVDSTTVRLAPAAIFALLTKPNAQEWQQAVDPTSPTRLLASQGWVARADASLRCDDQASALAPVQRATTRAQRLAIWPPTKMWFVLHTHEGYWPCSLTPELRTLATMRLPHHLGQYALFWPQLVYLIAHSLLRHRTLLDRSPSNFGFDGGSYALFYLDDEVYTYDRVSDIVHWERWRRVT